jgi:hypothetical protein
MKGTTMSVYKKLYEDYNNKSDRAYDSLVALQEVYNIPDDVIERHMRYESEAMTAWTDYWSALCEPFWTKAWRTLFRKK